MKSCFLRALIVSIATLFVLTLVVSSTAITASAQVRPALVKNVDEPGRTPFETRSQFLPNAGGCYNNSDCYNYSDGSYSASFDLKTVPAGKRWVITSVTGGFTSGASRTGTTIQLSNAWTGIVFDGLKWAYGGPFYPDPGEFNSVIFTANTFIVLNPGDTPHVRVLGDPSLNGYSVIVFSGYLIDATN